MHAHGTLVGCLGLPQMHMGSGPFTIGRTPPSAWGKKTVMAPWAPRGWGSASSSSSSALPPAHGRCPAALAPLGTRLPRLHSSAAAPSCVACRASSQRGQVSSLSDQLLLACLGHLRPLAERAAAPLGLATFRCGLRRPGHAAACMAGPPGEPELPAEGGAQPVESGAGDPPERRGRARWRR